MYRIEYDYLDKRGSTRHKKIECGTIDRVKFHCKNISELTEHKPIGLPRITHDRGDMPDKELNYYDYID